MSTVAGGSVPAFFYKDGRKVSVGDCALFKPPQDSPPLVGIICSIKLSKEYILELCVNWLYWPTEVKLGKGIPLEAAPNEVIYSFHKDEIPAASLLHPCKIAFLPKGVELPSGISAFICRRVYDIANKCLWWLTDQEYIDEQQEEVEQLLNKTRIEMYATVQSGGRSAKLVNGPTSQLKLGSDKVQSSTSFPSHAKGKKRERADHGSEPVKKECYAKMDDGNSIQFKSESLKAEISKITEKGGLVDSGGVEKLVQLMQPDRSERKMEVVRRSMLAGVIATTENFECLDRFVHLKGSLVLDEWLQDVHKGKIGDSSPKDGDKSVEEFLFVSLRALDKLTGNLQALQICNISKSVNRLCSHKNFEIQKKARSLVDTWKKRVDAEMNVIDAHSRSCLPEVSHGGSRHPGGASDIAIKSTIPEPVSNISPNGRFRCIISGWQRGELLGRGSFGSVYEGIADGGFFFAVKEVSLLDKSYLGRQSIYQLKQEIAFLSQFEHKNIVQYYGTDKDESNLYIFLELETMGSLLSIYRKYDLGDYRVSSYTRQILHGLKYLHERDVVHRDIKCANILVDANGSVKLADFGLAKTTKLNDVKSCKGTVFWMAPEVVKRENENDGYGLAADIWSLGCTVLELLTRQIPYSDLEWGQALFRIGRGHPPPVPDSLSRDARDFILECLKVDPKARPTAAQLLDHPFVRRSLPPSSGLSSPYHPARRI